MSSGREHVPQPPPTLLPQHQALLDASGISPALAAARGYRSLTSPAELVDLGFEPWQARVPALLIPQWGVDGKVVGHQVRPDDPRIDRRGRPVKYESPPGSRLRIDVPPSVRDQVLDSDVTLVITEGGRKADAAASVGIPCISISGVWAWRGMNEHGQKAPLADWDAITLKGRDVIVAFDSDVTTKPSVRDALVALRAFLVSRGASVRVALLPPGPGGAKTGLDDYLAAGHGLADLISLTGDTTPSGKAASAAGQDAQAVFPEPEDRGQATETPLGGVEYVEDLVRPGRIVTWAAEEGSGKSFTVAGELGVRVAVAGGMFAGTWPVLQTGPVLYLSEMHEDDDLDREDTVLASLGLSRTDLAGRYYRLPLMTAARGRPALMDASWCSWVTDWLRRREAVLLIVDTATSATQVEPWGPPIQGVYGRLRAMLAADPALAIILVVHVRKPAGRGERRISDVLGEWGRWCDVVVLQENEGSSLDRARISVRKRVRHERQIIVTKRGGLLVDPVAPIRGGPKVPLDDVVDAVEAHPGMTAADLAAALGVSRRTAQEYAATAETAGRVRRDASGQRGAMTFWPAGLRDRATARDDVLARSAPSAALGARERAAGLETRAVAPRAVVGGVGRKIITGTAVVPAQRPPARSGPPATPDDEGERYPADDWDLEAEIARDDLDVWLDGPLPVPPSGESW